MKKTNRRWELCPFCNQIKLDSGSNHTCPDAVKINREIEIDGIVEEELVMFELGLDHFWDDPHTKFDEWLADNGEI